MAGGWIVVGAGVLRFCFLSLVYRMRRRLQTRRQMILMCGTREQIVVQVVSLQVRRGEPCILIQQKCFDIRLCGLLIEFRSIAFVAQVAARNRMVTRDRLIGWGLTVPSNCVLCSGHDESRQHLFFDCYYSSQVWTFFLSRLHLTPPQGFEDVLRWLLAPSRDKNMVLIVRQLHQATLYLVWKERNSRVHTSVEKPTWVIIAEIQQILRLRLDPVARRQTLLPGQPSVLATWLSFFALQSFQAFIYVQFEVCSFEIGTVLIKGSS